MLTHQDIWTALDKLADKFSMSPSAMARQAGLDPTTFNKSKRNARDGKARWPSTESLSKVLNTLGVGFEDFARLAAKNQAERFGMEMGANVPLINMSQAGRDNIFDKAGNPMGNSWDEIRVPGVNDDNIFAMQISGDAMSPTFRNGDRVIVSPGAGIKRGDRVVVKTRSGEIFAKVFNTMNTARAHLLSLNPEYPDRNLPLKDIQWMARIVWVSQ